MHLVEYNTKIEKTKTVKDDLDPKYGETFMFETGDDVDMTFKLYDEDPLKDDFLALVTVPVAKAPFEEWLPFTSKTGANAGYLLVRIDHGKDVKLPTPPVPAARPKCVPCPLPRARHVGVNGMGRIHRTPSWHFLFC
jgi:hypothetical protein